MADVALLGVGRMGAAMVRRLGDAGHRVTVWNRTVAAALAAAESGDVHVASTPAEAVAAADLVISMFASGTVTRDVLLDKALVARLRPNAIVMDMATSGVEVARDLEAGLSGRGVRFVDAPVSGSVATVSAGELLVMASGSRSGVADAEPIVSAFAARIAYLGDAGLGQSMKLAVNLIVYALNSAVSEALSIATRAGINAEDAYDVFQSSVVAAPFVNYKRPAFLDESTPVAMSLALVMKDLGLINELARGQQLNAPLAQALLTEATAACEAGFGDADMAGLARYLEGQRKAGR